MGSILFIEGILKNIAGKSNGDRTKPHMIKFLDKLESFIVGILGIIMLALALFQITARYAFPQLIARGGEEFIVYVFVWAAMIACARQVTIMGHVRANLFLRLMPLTTVRVIETINVVASLILCAIFIWYGSQVVEIALLIDERSQTGISFPMWIYYLALPVGAALMAIRFASLLARLVLDKDSVTTEGMLKEPGL